MAYEIVPCLYDSHKDLSSRLDSTVCRYDGVPYFVRIADYNQLWLYDLKTPSTSEPVLKIKPKDPLFDISSPELGYMNANPKVVFKNTNFSNSTGNVVIRVVRSPLRQWKQGINPDCISFSTISGVKHLDGMFFSYQSIIYSQSMKDLILNAYPTPKDALDMLESNHLADYRTIAVSREVGLELTDSGVIQVYLRTKNVGFITPRERVVNIKPNPYSWIVKRVLSSVGLEYRSA